MDKVFPFAGRFSDERKRIRKSFAINDVSLCNEIISDEKSDTPLIIHWSAFKDEIIN